MRYIDIWQNDTGVWKLVAADLIQLAPTQFSYAYQVTKFTMANGTTTVYPGPGRTDTMTLSLECTQEQCINLLYATQNSPVLTIANMRSEIGEASSSLKYGRTAFIAGSVSTSLISYQSQRYTVTIPLQFLGMPQNKVAIPCVSLLSDLPGTYQLNGERKKLEDGKYLPGGIYTMPAVFVNNSYTTIYTTGICNSKVCKVIEIHGACPESKATHTSAASAPESFTWRYNPNLQQFTVVLTATAAIFDSSGNPDESNTISIMVRQPIIVKE